MKIDYEGLLGINNDFEDYLRVIWEFFCKYIVFFEKFTKRPQNGHKKTFKYIFFKKWPNDYQNGSKII